MPYQPQPIQRARDKENMAPSSRAFGLTSSSSSKRAHALSEDNDDYGDPDDSYRRRKKAHASSSSAARPNGASKSGRYADEQDDLRAVKKHGSSSSRPKRDDVDEGSEAEVEGGLWSGELLTERKTYDQWVENRLAKLATKRDMLLEDKVDRLKNELDEVQRQYDELRRLRQTVPEKALDDFKRTAETRHRHDKDLISSLKSKMEAGEKRARESSGAPDRSASVLHASVRDSVQPESADVEELRREHRRELADAARTQRKLEEEVKTYKLQLEQEIAQSKALLATAGSSSAAAAVSRNGKSATDSVTRLSLPLNEHEKAVRKLYEDLTGIVITGVEEIHSDSKTAPAKPFKRFKAVFAQEKHHSLQFDLEESQSMVQDDKGKKFMRQDMVYVPRLNGDKDQEFLDDPDVPDAWKESIRFVKGAMFNWYDKTRKILRIDNTRAR